MIQTSSDSACMDLAVSIDMSDVLDRFAEGKATILDLEALTQRAERSGIQLVQVTVRRKRNPRNRPIRLLGKAGPFCSSDRDVVPVERLLWAAWWRVVDCRLWLNEHRTEVEAARLAS